MKFNNYDVYSATFFFRRYDWFMMSRVVGVLELPASKPNCGERPDLFATVFTLYENIIGKNGYP